MVFVLKFQFTAIFTVGSIKRMPQYRIMIKQIIPNIQTKYVTFVQIKFKKNVNSETKFIVFVAKHNKCRITYQHPKIPIILRRR